MTHLELAGVSLHVGSSTDRGMRRTANEDSFYAGGPAFVVADGMGGYEHGDRASAAVAAAFEDRLGGMTLGTFDAVQDALLDADDRVAVVAGGTQRGAGSTATGIVLVSHHGRPYWLVFNVGDSRVYRYSAGSLVQVTKDHSLGRELVDAGELMPEDLATFKDRNVITRAIGAADSLADSLLVPVIVGDRLLMCSDGLHGEIPDTGLAGLLGSTEDVNGLATTLISAANAAGGRDNVTAVIVDVVGLDLGTRWEAAVAEVEALEEHDDTVEVG